MRNAPLQGRGLEVHNHLKQQYKARDKITQKMTRDGAITENQATGETERISKREQDADFQKTPEQQAAQDAAQLSPPAQEAAAPLPHLPGTPPKADAAAERVIGRIDAAQTRQASKKAVRRAQQEDAQTVKPPRLRFTDDELPPDFREKYNPLSLPAQEAGLFIHNKIHSVEKDNSGVEGAHKTEEAAERGARYGARKVKQGYRSHKLKPYRQAAKAEQAAAKANANLQYQKLLQENPQLQSNPLSRFMQKQKIKREYAKAARTGGATAAQTARTAQKAAANTRKAAQKTAEQTRKAAAFVARHPAGVCITAAALLLFIMLFSGLSSCSSVFTGTLNGILGTSYTSEDADLVAVENNYAAKETELQSRIDNIESEYPGYDEYRYDLDAIGHNPHELASFLTALLQSYTPASAQGDLQLVFDTQYVLTITPEVEIRYRTETSTDPETGETTSEEVPYEYYILNVSLTNTPITDFAPQLLNAEQLEMFRVYLETSGNKPLLFGGGSADTSASEDISGVEFVGGTRPGNTALTELAQQQVGNVGGAPYWSWYGFESRVEWCACFVSWCYGQAGLSEPRFAGCQSQGVPWFTSRGQWGARGYENIAPGDAIFFDWDLDGSADHVGLVIGTDGSRVYTVEGNSGDACKIKSYSLDYACIKGYGLMNWS